MITKDNNTAAFAATTKIADLHPDLLLHILRKLDGHSLAAATCSNSRLRSTIANSDIWQQLCFSNWPSICLLPSLSTSHHRFFSDAAPFPTPNSIPRIAQYSTITNFISAVDIHHKTNLVLSKMIHTDARSLWFLSSPFRLDALERKSPEGENFPEISPDELILSWIVIDPVTSRAVNLSSRRPVCVDRHWYTGEVQARFAIIGGGGSVVAVVVVNCGGEGKMVKEISLKMEDEDGLCLTGEQSLVAIKEMMEGHKMSGKQSEAAAVERRYWEYERRKKERKKKIVEREGRLELVCVVVGIFLFFGFVVVMVLR